MSRYPAQKQGRARKANIHSVPAPTGGLNTLDSIALMDSKYAVVLQNFIPTPSSVSLRSGSVAHSTGLTGRVETLCAYNSASASKLFAAIGGSIYDVTASGAVGAAVVTGKTNARWQHVNFATTGGSYLIMVNGADAPMLYDGTTWTAITGVSSPAITGVTSTDLINVSVFQNKLWFVEKNSMRVWYLSSASIGGLANQLDLSSLFPRGGYLMAMGDWTMDSGSGVDDYAVFISSEGEVAVYRGTDPASASTWALVGVYQIGSPVGRRCLMKFASDLVIINQDGIQLISQALTSSRVTLTSSVTDKIQPTITNAVTTYGSSFGWETILFSSQNVIMLNVPSAYGSQQYVMNTITKGWCNFTGWDASCFEVMNDRLFFGTTDGVMEAFVGTDDAGTAINGHALQAFSYMGNQNLKNFTMARPILATNANDIGVLLSINTDFNVLEPIGTPTYTSGTAGVWGASLWGIGLWGGAMSIKKDWNTVGATGLSGALYMKTLSGNSRIEWSATDYIYESGSSFF